MKRVVTPAVRPIRHDGWTAAVQTSFIEMLARTGSVAQAAAAVGRTTSTAYRLRARPEGNAFRLAWEAATAHAYERVREIALDRLLNGVEAPVVYRGEIVDHKRVFSDRLLMFMLDHLKPPVHIDCGVVRIADNERGYAAALSALADAPPVTDDEVEVEAPPPAAAPPVAEPAAIEACPAAVPALSRDRAAEAPAMDGDAPVPDPADEWFVDRWTAAAMPDHIQRMSDPANPYRFVGAELLSPEDQRRIGFRV